MTPPQLAAVPLAGQFPPFTVPVGAYTPKERVVLHMATRQKRRVFWGYFPLLSSNSSDDPSDVGDTEVACSRTATALQLSSPARRTLFVIFNARGLCLEADGSLCGVCFADV